MDSLLKAEKRKLLIILPDLNKHIFKGKMVKMAANMTFWPQKYSILHKTCQKKSYRHANFSIFQQRISFFISINKINKMHLIENKYLLSK